jgi:histidine ammonia-lyase
LPFRAIKRDLRRFTLRALALYSESMTTEVAKEAKEVTLTPEQVEEIRRKANTPGITYAQVAAEYGIDTGHVRFIARRYL